MQKWNLYIITSSPDQHKVCQAEPQKCTIVNTSRYMLADTQTNKVARPPHMGIKTYICIISFYPPQVP
jgi:hypothetical protein